MLYGPDKSLAVSVFEEVLDEPSDSVFVLYRIRNTFLLFQRVLKVLLTRDLVAILIDQTKGKVSQDPQERREVLSQLIWIFGLLIVLNLQ